MDIGGGLGVIWSKTLRLARGAGVDTAISETMPLYTLGTFVANGGSIYVTIDGDCDVFDIIWLIKRDWIA